MNGRTHDGTVPARGARGGDRRCASRPELWVTHGADAAVVFTRLAGHAAAGVRHHLRRREEPIAAASTCSG